MNPLLVKALPACLIATIGTLAATTAGTLAATSTKNKMNIIFLYADDLGYGDVACLNPESKIPTPNMDRLASEGVSFTDAHSPAAICGPSRYGLLTGRYPWRNKGGTSNGSTFCDLKISRERLTVARLLKAQDYTTGQIGKWGVRHMYRDALKEDVEWHEKKLMPDDFDFKNKKLLGANLCGFDYSGTVTHLSNKKDDKYLFENGTPSSLSTFAPLNSHDVLPTLVKMTVNYIETYAGKRNDPIFNIDRTKPFFLYLDPPVPHEPIVPNKQFIGKSKAGGYGDFVVEFDDYLGQILDALDRSGLAQNTIVMVSSDNGPEISCYPRIIEFNHRSMGEWRGAKRDVWEGGNRVPFFVRWPGVVKKGTTCVAPIVLTDFLATLADMTGTELPAGTTTDSYSFLEYLKGGKPSEARPPIIYHTLKGRMAIRDGDWVYIHGPDGMGSKEKEPQWFRDKRKVVPDNESFQLFNLKKDPQQLENLYAKHPEKAKELLQKLESIMNKKLK